MKKNIVILFLLIICMGGCMKEESPYDFGATTKIDDYVGQGNVYNNGEKYIEFVAENEEELIKVAIEFMKEEYGLNVTASSARAADGFSMVAVRVEEPFYFQTLVAIDNKNFNNVGVFGDLLANDTAPGVYAWLHEEEIDNLNNVLNELASEYNLKGFRDEAIANLSFGYDTSFYSISGVDAEMGEKFYEDIKVTKYEMEDYVKKFELVPRINIKFYTSEEITKDTFNIIKKYLLDKSDILPEGSYALTLSSDEILNDKGDSNEEGISEVFDVKK